MGPVSGAAAETTLLITMTVQGTVSAAVPITVPMGENNCLRIETKVGPGNHFTVNIVPYRSGA